ncbi:MAG: restriction endonuclease subunit S [Acidobacteria bacterium]|nr:restriction endonuclease subunit S [Acidobacteriota bacterium]
MNEWNQVRFGDLLSEPVRNGIYKSKEFHGKGSHVVNMGELFAHPRLKTVEMNRVMLTDREKEKSLLRNNDLIFARRSLTAEGAGKCSLVYDLTEETTFESSIIRARPDQSLANSEFLFYYFNSLQGKHLLGTILRQVAVSGITGSDLTELILRIPPLEEQKAIAKILSAFDDKIELNRRMNATLEAMARALFKAWFVDFEPVHANHENRPSTSASPEIAKLFPSTLENNIPKGWRFKPLGEIADVNWGDTSVTKKSYVLEGFSAYSASGSDGFLPYFDFERPGIVVSAIGANSGLTWLARGKWSAIKNTITIFSANERVSTEYLYLATIGKENWTLRGSAQPFLSQTDTRAKKILFPANSISKSLCQKLWK